MAALQTQIQDVLAEPLIAGGVLLVVAIGLVPFLVRKFRGAIRS
jgi:hypothetical protein